MNVHPVAELFPMLPDAELRDLADGIEQEGLLNPCVMQGDTLLDGRNRLAACKLAGVKPRFTEYTGDSPVAFIIASNLVHRRLSKDQKYALYIEVRPYYEAEAKKLQREHGGTTHGRKSLEANVPQVKGRKPQARDQAAAAVGISGKTGDKLNKLKNEDPELFKVLLDGKTTLPKAMGSLKSRQDKRDLAAAQKTISAEKRKSIESVCDLRVCSCADLFQSGIKPDAVITDPPYPAEFLPVFSELAEGCKLAGVPLVAVMSGQSYLPEVMQRLCEHLEYRWTLAYMTPGASCRIWPLKVDCQWKPILLFGGDDYVFDVFRSDAGDKRFHGWGQSESGMADLVERLTKPGQLVCDPFLGGGTTAVVSLALGRRFVGCDIDAEHVEQTKARVMV